MTDKSENEISPLLSSIEDNSSKSYTNVLARTIDEEEVTSSSDSEATVDLRLDSELIVQNKLGKASLSMITFCLCLSGFLASADTSIVTTIFNEIGTEFKSSNLSVWIMVSYILSTSALTPLYGKLSDIFGRKSTLVSSIFFFFVGSWLCGLSNSIVQISIARAVAGIGGGGLATLASVIIHDLIPIRNRGKYQSYINMSQTIGTTIGAPLGGIITDYFGWRYCFYVNLPPCLFMLYIFVYKMENYNLEPGAKPMHNITEKLKKVDFIGAALFLVGNVLFVTGASLGGNTHEWDDPLVVSLLVSAASFFVSFGVYEFNWAHNPLISRTLIKNRNVVAVCLNNFFLCSSAMAFIYLVPQYFMGVLGYNTSSAGLWVLPRTAMVAVGCWTSGRYLSVAGKYKHFVVSIIAIEVLTTFGTLSWNESTAMWFRVACMNLEGFCFGIVLVATMIALVADIAREDTASATSMIFLCRSAGWLSSSTITAAILQYSFKKNLSKSITGPEAAEIIEFVRTSITKVRTLAPEIQIVVISSLEKAIHTAYHYGVICAILCFLCAVCMRNCRLGAKL